MEARKKSRKDRKYRCSHYDSYYALPALFSACTALTAAALPLPGLCLILLCILLGDMHTGLGYILF